MKWRTDNPPVAGKYLVETQTAMGNIHRLESSWNGKTWSFSNQLFQRWLDEAVPKTETLMVVIPVDFHNARKVCENIQNNTYASSSELRDHLNKELEVDTKTEEHPMFFDLNCFMDECNDQYLNVENYFISYVEIIKK